MIGNIKLSALIQKSEWDSAPVQSRVGKCISCGLEGKSASKSWEDLTIAEALTLTGKLPHWQDPIMSAADYERARINRESYTPKRPDGKEETDESRERRRALDAELRQRNKPTPVPKKKPVWDSVQMKMIYR